MLNQVIDPQSEDSLACPLIDVQFAMFTIDKFYLVEIRMFYKIRWLSDHRKTIFFSYTLLVGFKPQAQVRLYQLQ